MNLGWKSSLIQGKQGNVKQIRPGQEKVFFCRICNKPVTGEHICQSCRAFIDQKRREEQRTESNYKSHMKGYRKKVKR